MRIRASKDIPVSPATHYLPGTEKVGSDSGRESCSIFYLEMAGGAVLIRKTEVEETQSRIPSLRARVFRDQIPSEPHPSRPCSFVIFARAEG